MEPVRIIGEVNEVNKEFVDNYAKINQLYKQHFEDMERMNQQWLDSFWKPLVADLHQRPEEEEKK